MEGVKLSADVDAKSQRASVTAQGGNSQFFYRVTAPSVDASNPSTLLNNAVFTIEKKRDKKADDSRRTFFTYTYEAASKNGSIAINHMAEVFGKQVLCKADTGANTGSAYVMVDDSNTARVNHTLSNDKPRLAWTHKRGDTELEPSVDLEDNRLGLKVVHNLSDDTQAEVALHNVSNSRRHATARVKHSLGGANNLVAKLWYSSDSNEMAAQLGMMPSQLGGEKVKLMASGIELSANGLKTAPRLSASFNHQF